MLMTTTREHARRRAFSTECAPVGQLERRAPHASCPARPAADVGAPSRHAVRVGGGRRVAAGAGPRDELPGGSGGAPGAGSFGVWAPPRAGGRRPPLVADRY